MTLPAGSTVAVIGAGIVGVSAAIWLQRAGYRVVLIDRDGPASGTSHGNAGVLAACSVVPVTVPGLVRKAPGMLLDANSPLYLRWGYLPKLMPWLVRYLSHCDADKVEAIAAALAPLARDCLAQHQALADGTGAARYINPGNYVFAYADKAHFESDGFGWSIRKRHQFTWQELDQAGFAAKEPNFGPGIGYAAAVGDHGRISDPGHYVKALADHAIDQGAQWQRGTVQGLVSSGQRLTGIRIDGQTLDCDAAVIATGVWSGPLARELGINVALESERGYHLEFWEPNRMPSEPTMVAALKVVATPMQGRLRLAGAVEFGGLDSPASEPPFGMLERAINELMPGLTYSRTERWMGHRPAPADSIPIIGPAPQMPNAFLAFGHHHIGLTCGPKTGRLIAQLVAGNQPEIPVEPYDPVRWRR